MFAKWLDEYQKVSKKTRFVSRLAAFLISVFVILSLYDIAHFFYVNPSNTDKFFEIHLLITSVLFQSVIFVVFTSRFAVSFFISKKTFVFDKFLWLIGLTMLVIFWYISIPEPTGFVIYSTVPDSIFKHTSLIFSGFGTYYLILSPLRQITTIVIALIKSK